MTNNTKKMGQRAQMPKPSVNLVPLKLMEDMYGPNWHLMFLQGLSHVTLQLVQKADGDLSEVDTEMRTLCNLQLFLWEFVEPYYSYGMYEE